MTDNRFKTTARKRKSEQTECRICGSPAFYSYFGVISCEACKVFFKRNAHHEQNRFKCSYGGQCEVNMNNRHICTPCRLAKCFAKGMKAEMIRRSTINKKISTMSNTLVKSSLVSKVKPFLRRSSELFLFQLPTLNLLERDNSSLDETQWILLSNLIHNYQEDKLLFLSAEIKNQNTSLKIVNQSTVHNLLGCFYETAGHSLRVNGDIVRLKSNDRSMLLQTAAANITLIAGQYIYYHSGLVDDELFWKYLEQIYGNIVICYRRLARKFIQPDMALCKLSTALFALSTNTRIFCGDIQNEYENLSPILRIQDRYAELVWKYLLYKYGYEESIKRYVHVIEWFLASTALIPLTYNLDAHVSDLKSIIERTEMDLILDDVDRLFEDDINRILEKDINRIFEDDSKLWEIQEMVL